MRTSTASPQHTSDEAGGARRPGRWRWLLPAIVVVVWLVGGGPLGSFAGKLTEVQSNEPADFLPGSAESTRVAELRETFAEEQSLPAVVVWEADGPVTPALTAQIEDALSQISSYDGLVGPPSPPIVSDDGRAVQAVIPLEPDLGDGLTTTIDDIRVAVDVDGATAYVTGPAGVQADFGKAFEGIDGLLLLVAFGVVLLILVVVYRSPILPLLVIATAVLALGAASAVNYVLVDNGFFVINGQSQGLTFILVVGAATDYGLLLVARFREELRKHESRYDAMRLALRGSVEPIVASGATVILGVLCLLFSDLGSNRGLGPVAAVGIAMSVVAALTFLPAVLVLLGRAAFWPFRPQYGSEVVETSGIWGRVASLVDRKPRQVLAVSVLALVAAAAFAPTLDADGISQSDAIRGESEAVTGQAVQESSFPGGAGSPVVVITPTASAGAVGDALDGVEGIESVEVGDREVDGLVEVQATLAAAPDSDAAIDVVRDVRSVVRDVDTDALVGGFTATELDTRETTQRDRAVIVPVTLLVITLVLALLLRSITAPLVLLASVVLSYAATLGIASLVFDAFGSPGSDPGVPLIAFVFLVALGVDYNIFLMTRVREEAQVVGTRRGVVVALAVTGGVITSAGLVLAATFGALAVLPLLVLAQVAFLVGFGVLLDTFVVRSLVVPAAVHLLDHRTWWPGRMWRSPVDTPPSS